MRRTYFYASKTTDGRVEFSPSYNGNAFHMKRIIREEGKTYLAGPCASIGELRAKVIRMMAKPATPPPPITPSMSAGEMLRRGLLTADRPNGWSDRYGREERASEAAIRGFDPARGI
jgi:hypothetical protein